MARVGSLSWMARVAGSLSVVLVTLFNHSSNADKSGESALPQVTNVPVCDEQQPASAGLVLHLLPEHPHVSFKCTSTGTAVLEPEVNEAQAYVKQECVKKELLTNLCPGAQLTEVPAGPKNLQEIKAYQLGAPLDGRLDTTSYFKCKITQKSGQERGSGGGETEEGGAPGGGAGVGVRGDTGPSTQTVSECLVTVKVTQTPKKEQASEQQGSEEHGERPNVERPVEVTDCNAGTVAAELSTDKSLKFRCPNDQKLVPTSSASVYDDSDGQCSKEVQLSSLVKAALKPANPSSEEEGRKTVYELTLESPPIHDAALCYKCVSSEANSKPSPSTPVSMRTAAAEVKECSLKVSVKGTHRPASSAFRASESSLWLLGSVMVSLVLSSL